MEIEGLEAGGCQAEEEEHQSLGGTSSLDDRPISSCMEDTPLELEEGKVLVVGGSVIRNRRSKRRPRDTA